MLGLKFRLISTFSGHETLPVMWKFYLHLVELLLLTLVFVPQGGLPMYMATRGLYRMAPPIIVVPAAIKENVEKLFEAHRAMDHSEMKHNLIGLNVGNAQFVCRLVSSFEQLGPYLITYFNLMGLAIQSQSL